MAVPAMQDGDERWHDEGRASIVGWAALMPCTWGARTPVSRKRAPRNNAAASCLPRHRELPLLTIGR